MKLKMYLAALLSVSMAVGCNREEIENVENVVDAQDEVNSKDNVYVSVSVQLPEGPQGKSNTIDPNDDYSTSSDGTEVGKDYENKVSKALIVLARTADNGYITHGAVDEVQMAEGASNFLATAKFSKTALATYYGNDESLDASLGEQKINIFVVCNYTTELEDTLKKIANGPGKYDTSWIDEICSVTEDNSGNSYENVAVWQQNNMLMTNASIATKNLPLNLSDWDAFTASTTPFNLSGSSYTPSGELIDNVGAIRVERAVARFDFKDGSELGGNKYHAVYLQNEDGSTTDYVDIELNRMALVNMSNQFYYFRRVTDVANKDNDDQTVEVGWPELPWLSNADGNYVVDVDYDKKEAGTTYFNFPLFDKSDNKTINETARGQWYTSKILDVLKEDGEKDEYDDKSYHIWRYVTENTVNSTERMVNGLSTGVVFKGKMIPADYLKNPQAENEETTKALKKLAYVLGYGQGDFTAANLGLSDDDIKDIKVGQGTNADPILYAHAGMLYLRWTSVRDEAIKAAKIGDTEEYDKTNTFYQAVFGTGSHDDTHDDTEDKYSNDETSPDYLWKKWQDSDESQKANALTDFKKAATANGFTLYQSSNDDENGWGYYCYYFYWNQHNNNNNDNPNVMGEMEFAVVRNNVYKLAVTKINRLGHPRLSENDPTPPDPGTPDEKGDVYIEVSVEVLPWVVRKNDIEF